jgi:hypothetical protein
MEKINMVNSKHIAALIGPAIMALTKYEARNIHIWAKYIAPVTYLNITLLFVAILSIICVYNRWMGSWPDALTHTCWVAIPDGQFQMFAPQAQHGGQNTCTYAMIIVLFVIGFFLTFKSYNRRKN